MHPGLPVQRGKHPRAHPQGHEDQPHQHDPHRHRRGRLPQHARVHPLQHPHVPAGQRSQAAGGHGQDREILQRSNLIKF